MFLSEWMCNAAESILPADFKEDRYESQKRLQSFQSGNIVPSIISFQEKQSNVYFKKLKAVEVINFN